MAVGCDDGKQTIWLTTKTFGVQARTIGHSFTVRRRCRLEGAYFSVKAEGALVGPKFPAQSALPGVECGCFRGEF